MKESFFSCTDSNGDELQYLYQWDTNRVIYVTFIQKNDTGDNIGFSGQLYFHFCNRRSSTTYVVEAEKIVRSGASEYLYKCRIPNELLMEPDDIKVYMAETKTLFPEKRTLASMIIPVIQRPMPIDYAYRDVASDIPVADDLTTINGMVQLSSHGVPFGQGVSL